MLFMNTSPVTEGERIHQLDVIRGFALFGIILVNMPTFLHPMLFLPLDGLPVEHTTLDEWIRLFFNMFVQTKFYTIFSFLFGAGFFLFMSRAEQKQLPMKRLFSRRILVLLLVGMLHLIFLWYGDILHTYALTGFLLLLFYHRKQGTVRKWAWTLLIIYQLLMLLLLLVPSNPALENNPKLSTLVAQAIQVYNEGAWSEWMQFRIAYELPYVLANEIFAVFSILPLFLLGFAAARQGVFQRTADYLLPIKRIWWISLVLSVPLVAMIPLLQAEWVVLPASKNTAIQVFVGWSGLTLCAFYISSFLLLCMQAKWLKRFSGLALVGRMAFSNYLFQTIVFVCIVRFFHVYGTISLAMGTVICIILLAFQVWISRWWLSRFAYGPLEWGWRCLTYLQKVPLRKEKKA
jgi:uncharacterized protein